MLDVILREQETLSIHRGGNSSTKLGLVSCLVSWCFKPGQPQRIILGLKETFIKRYIVERTKKAEIRPKEQPENRVRGRYC